MRAIPLIPALLLAACGPKLVDCDAIAAEQPDCMNDAARASCERENAACEARPDGEVLTLETCPLSFACSASALDG